MADSSINQRIVLTGAEEVRRHLDAIAAAGQRAGNQTRAAVLAATGQLNTYTAATGKAADAHAGFSAQAQAASHSLRSMTEQVLLGAPPMTVLTQQMNHLSFAATGPGGLRGAFGEVTSALTSLITPTTLAVAGLVAIGVELAVVISRAATAEESAKKFDVILKATGKSGQTTGKQLEEAASQLHDVGLSTSEARDQFTKFIQAGGRADLAPQVTRIGAELEAVLGKGSMEKFRAAAAEGGPALEDFAKKLGIIPKAAADTSKGLDAAAQSAAKFNAAIATAVEGSSRSIAQEQKNSATAIADLTRKRGTDAQEIERASSLRIQQINKDTNDAIIALIVQRNKETATQLAAYNKQIEDAAQAAGNNQSLIAQIGERVLGSFQGQLTPTQEAVLALSTAWDNLQKTLAQSGAIKTVVTALGDMISTISAAIVLLDALGTAIKNTPALPRFLGGSGEPTVPGSAGGEYVRGPGTGTSDSILRRVSNGEFIVNALATRMNLPLLHAINSMRSPAMPRMRMPRGFAMGGLVGAGGGGARTPIHLHVGGEVFGLESDAATAQRVIRFGRKRAALSAGRRPSTA